MKFENIKKIMKSKKTKKISVIALATVLCLSAVSLAFAHGPGGHGGNGGPGGGYGGPGGNGGPGFGGGTTNYADSPTEIVTSELTSNSAEKLTADYSNATTITMSDSDNQVKITEAGTYIISGNCSDGNIAVKKGTTGVVLVLKDLDLTSTTGATVSLNKGTEVKVIIEGTVSLTDKEDIANEESDDFDGAALKAKVGSNVVLTGTGTLNINGVCKNGIKISGLDDEDKAEGYTDASFIIDGEKLTINITADNDGVNSGSDLTIKSGTINVSAGDDGIGADYIMTIGAEGTDGPTITVKESNEGIESATINIYSGTIDVTATDDGINAANKNLTDYTYSLNIMGGNITISAGADGIDSNGNVNILGGLTTIAKSASNGGEGGLDYEGSCYVADGCLVNPFGTTMDSGMGGNGGFGNRDGGFGGKQPDSNSGATSDADGNTENKAPDGAPGRPDRNGAPGSDDNGQNNGAPAPPDAPEKSENETTDTADDTAESQNWFSAFLSWLKSLFLD